MVRARESRLVPEERMYTIGNTARSIRWWLGFLACAACQQQSNPTNPVERRVTDELLGPNLLCVPTEDIRWAAEGPLNLCSAADSSESIVVVRRMQGGEALQFAKRSRYSDSDSALAAFSAVRGRVAAAIGQPDTECEGTSGRRAQSRRGELSVSIVLLFDQRIVDESWTIRESPVVNLCDGQGAS